MRRWVLGTCALAALVAAVGLGARAPREGPAAPVVAGPEVRVVRGAASGPAVSESEEAPQWEARAAAVRAACDLPVASRCDGDGCVALASGPDLDGLAGWFAVIGERPRFVATVLLRDVGVAPAWMPCGGAIAQLAPDGVILVELPDGSELWCAGDAARCDALAGFGAPTGAFVASKRRLMLAAR